MKKYLVLVSVLLFSTASFSQSVPSNKKNVNNKPYPYNNPIITHMYTADAAPHVMPDGKVWVVTSVDDDNGGGYNTMHRYHIFSSPDMVGWTDHGEILNLEDLIGTEEPEGEDWALWAPDMVYRNGMYYLYFPVRILYPNKTKPGGGRVVNSYIAVAKSDSLTKRFEIVNPKLAGTKGIDPAVFIDDDDTPYLYWGSHRAARLNDNMVELASKPKKLEIDTDRFMEAGWMTKRKGKYYISYHTKYNWRLPITAENRNDPNRKRSELAYSVGDSPMGPFTYGGTLNYELGVNVKEGPRSPDGDFVPWRLMQSNHGGIVEFHGQHYLFYHTSALSSWRQDTFAGPGTWTQRSVCVDKLDFKPDGSMITVRQTLSGINKVEINQPFAVELPAKDALVTTGVKKNGNGFKITDNVATLQFKDVKLGSGYYFFDMKVKHLEGDAYAELRLNSSQGKLIGSMRIKDSFLEHNNNIADTAVREANGTRDVFVILKQKGGNKLNISNLRFFAGAPT